MTSCIERGGGNRRRTRSLKITLAAVCLLAASAVLPGATNAKVRSFRASYVRHGVATFKVDGLAPARIRSGHLSGSRKRKLPRRKLRAAARRGVLRARVAGRHSKRWSRTRTQRLKLVVSLGSKAKQRHRGGRRVRSRSCSRLDFAVGTWPGACWRPYSDSSPFNAELPANPKLYPHSDAIASRLSGYRVGNLVAGTYGQSNDHGRPIYWARSSDPVYRIDCRSYCGTGVDGRQLHVPSRARPASGGDSHMGIVQPDGTEWSLWHARPPSDGRLVADGVGRGRIDGPGYDSRAFAHHGESDGGATAAHFPLNAGIIRAQELRAGYINHALVGDAPCSTGGNLWPATGGGGSTCDDRANALTMGMRLQLDPSYMTDRRLTSYPPWKRAILRALRDYGYYVEDTCGCDQWVPFTESGTQYASLGYQDQLEAFARDAYSSGQRDIDRYEGDYVFYLRDGVDWSHFRVIDPCVARERC